MYNYLLHLRTYFIIKRKAILNAVDPLQTTNYTPFIILCQPRSGSTLLHTYLNSNPQIKSYGEVLREAIEKKPQALDGSNIHDLIFGSHSSTLKAVGLKVFYEYSDDTKYKEVFQQVADQKNIHVIHLVRKDELKLFTSLKIAEETNVWSISKASAANKHRKIKIEPNEYEGFLRAYRSHRQLMTRLFEKHPCLMVEYESLVNDPQTTLDSIQCFRSEEHTSE